MRKLGAVLIVFGLGAAMALGLAACGGSSGKEGGTLTVSFASYPDSLDPQSSYTLEGWSAMYNTYIPLLTYAHADGEEGSEIVPGLAESLPKISEDGTTYTLELREGLKYSDGSPVRASDFETALERTFLLNSGGSPYYTVIEGAEEFAKKKSGGISGITTNGETGEIVIELTEPSGSFNNLLALLFAAPVPADTPDKPVSKEPIPATGPYEIVSLEPGRGWSYARNPQWEKANADLVTEVPDGHVDRIEAKVVSNQSTQVNEVEQGTTHWMYDAVPPDRVAEVKGKYEGSQYRVEPSVAVDFIWMNETQPPFDDLKVRQAVNYGLDTRQLERIYAGEMTGTHQVIPPGVPGYEEFDLYPFDMAKAQQLLKEANPDDLAVTFWTESLNEEAGEYFETMLDEIGFEADLKVTNSETYFTIVGNEKTPDLDLGFAGWAADFPNPNAFFEPLLSGASVLPANGTNLSRTDVPELTEKIEKLATEPLGPQQEEEYAALDREFMELAPWAPYGNPSGSLFVSEDVDFDGVIWNPIFTGDLTSFQLK